MATNLVVNFLGNNKLSKTTTAVSRDLKNLGNTANKVGQTMNRALGAVGVGLGLSVLIGQLKEASKAAAEDSKSQKQLALALKNTLGATDSAVAGAESWIQSLSNSVGIVDDQLRPALATAVRATGSLTKGQDLLNVALDVSAATGKDLGQVTKAIARAQLGQLGGLQRLIPGIKQGADVMGQLRTQFRGAAQEAANADPYQRISVIMDNLKETIGYALLPYLQQMADYLASPEGQKNLEKIVQQFVAMAKALGMTITFLVKNIGLIKDVTLLLVGLRLGWTITTTAVKLYTVATTAAATATRTLKYALISTGIGALVVVLGELASAFISAGDKADESGKKAKDAYYWLAHPEEKIKLRNDAFTNMWLARGRHAQRAIDQTTREMNAKLEEQNKKIRETASKFRDSIGLAFGVSGKDEYSYFNADMVIEKLKRIVDAAKGFARNIKLLVKQGAGQDVVNELIAMGPAQGNIVAKGLLRSGRLSEYLGLRGSLYQTGLQAGTIQQTTGEKTYTININKANVSAADIIKEIRKFEKQTGKKYFAN